MEVAALVGKATRCIPADKPAEILRNLATCLVDVRAAGSVSIKWIRRVPRVGGKGLVVTTVVHPSRHGAQLLDH